MKYRYFVPDDGETIDDAKIIVQSRFFGGDWVKFDDFTDDPEIAANLAAEQYQTRAEWHAGSRVFVIVDENNITTSVSVELEYAPVFTGRTVINHCTGEK